MAAAKPWMTSTDLVNSVKRKIAMPLSQVTFTIDDLLAFANEEMMIGLVPSILDAHEEYFVYTLEVPLVANQSRYAIPERALGSRLRDLKYRDSSGNLFDMSRIAAEDKAFWQANTNNSTVSKYYIEGNDVVLVPQFDSAPDISLVFYYFLRPNQLVANARAAIVQNFVSQITVLTANLVDGDTLTISNQTFTAVTGAPAANQFQIGVTDITSATNLANSINVNGVVAASNNNTSLVTLRFSSIALSQTVASSSTGLVIPTNTQMLEFDQVPTTYQDPDTFQTESLFANGGQVDLLQTRPGHRMLSLDVTIPASGISGTLVSFNKTDVPLNMVIGDYMCVANECIIPQIPPDLHNELAERTCTRILSALGDQAGMQASMAKVADMEKRQISLLDNRVESSPQKIVARHSILRYQKANRRQGL